MIEALKGFPENTVAFAARGQVTQSDYQTVVVPAVETALKTHKKLRVYYAIGSDFAGIDPGAVWEDFKIGAGHWLRWERIAVVTDIGWIRNIVRAFGFLMPAKLKVFPTAEAAQARNWLASGLGCEQKRRGGSQAASWQGMGCDHVKPEYRLALARDGYALVGSELAVFKPEA